MSSIVNRIIAGISLIAVGVGLNLSAILPYYKATVYYSWQLNHHQLYQPINPGGSVITGAPHMNYWLIGIGVVIILAGVFFMIWALKLHGANSHKNRI